MNIFTGAPIKSRLGTKSDVVRYGNNCLSYNANDGCLLSARCHRDSARRNILERRNIRRGEMAIPPPRGR
jgi:hypothetical protein